MVGRVDCPFEVRYADGTTTGIDLEPERTAVEEPAFPIEARPLIRDLADRVEERIP